VFAGPIIILSALLAALEFPVEVIGGFNVDGLAMIAIAIGVLLVVRALLGTGPAIGYESAAEDDAPPFAATS